MKPGERQRVWIVLLLILAVFVAFSAAGERGFIRLNAMGSERDELRRRVSELTKGNADLAEEISLLRDDQATIETLARTELGMAREGETIYILPEVLTEGPGSGPR
ncbi:MAG: septum formation initiator family protein [bacterium]|nr:septum formation initiator family protein [bacterium]MDT8395850.1 septum formation initiator family protein [bacterium]